MKYINRKRVIMGLLMLGGSLSSRGVELVLSQGMIQAIALQERESAKPLYGQVKFDLRGRGVIAVIMNKKSEFIYATADGNDFQSSKDGAFENRLRSDALNQAMITDMKKGPANGWAASDAEGNEVVNWLMFVPRQTRKGNHVAAGFVWKDTDESKTVNDGDVIQVKYSVTADTFEEIDTVAKLNSEVGR